MADESAARASEVAALFKIHGVDQRSSELVFTHPALDDGGHITLRQDGSNSEDFVPGTSTVIWPCAYSLGDFLCDATVANRESGDAQRDDPSYAANLGAVTPSSVVVEIGAGLGLAGLVAARLGAKKGSITDATTQAARRNLDTAGLGNCTVDELWWQRATWRRERGKAKAAKAKEGHSNAPATCDESNDESEPESDDEEPAGTPDANETVKQLLKSLPDGENPHMVIASDVCYSQGRREMQMLADTIGALCGDDTIIYVMFEDRGDCCWGTLQHFWQATSAAGLEGDPTPVEDILIAGKAREGEGRSNDSERLLLKLRRVRETPRE